MVCKKRKHNNKKKRCATAAESCVLECLLSQNLFVGHPPLTRPEERSRARAILKYSTVPCIMGQCVHNDKIPHFFHVPHIHILSCVFSPMTSYQYSYTAAVTGSYIIHCSTNGIFVYARPHEQAVGRKLNNSTQNSS